MFAALCLTERGVPVRILDKYGRTALRSYALALHPHSLRLMDELGVAATLVDRGQILRNIAVHHQGGIAEIDFAAVGGTHPFVLTLPQLLLEAALEKRLEDNGVSVEWNHQLLTFDAGHDGVTALVANRPEDSDFPVDVATHRIHSIFLIGADGYDSLTRRLMRIEHTVSGDPISLGLMEFEKDMSSPEQMHVVLGDDTTDVLWPLGAERGRWSVQINDPEDGEDASRIKDHVRQRSPWYGDDFGTIEWVTGVRFEPRIAERFGRGPVWLVGDAARFTSPIGVQSMNVGFREAHDLARRIAGILRDGRPPKLLDYYNEERQREWKMMLGIKDRLRTDGELPAWARAAAPRLVQSLPASGHDLNLLLEQIGLRLYWLRRRDGS